MTQAQQSIERRLVIGCSWLGMLFSAVGILVNWELGAHDGMLLWAVAFSALAFAAIAIAGRGGVPYGLLSGAFLCNVMFLIAATWEANGGVRGSTTPAIAAAVVFSVLALPGRHAAIAVSAPLAIFVTLCAIELWDGVPAALPFDGMGEALDALITTLMTSILCGVGLAMMRRVYDHNLEQLRAAKLRNEELATQAMLADREKTSFLARMSHDLRTPLAAIVGSLEVALQDPLRPPVAGLLTAARARCDDLERIIGDLLDVGIVESGELAIRMAPADLPELIEAVTQDARPAAGVRLAVHLEPGVPRRLLTDATRLRQALGNLLSNACKHTDDGLIDFRISAASGRIRFVVTDSGPGIDDGDLDLLFQPFSQLPRGRERGGAGLGLFITRQIATMFGGTLTLSPGRPGGLRAALELPWVEPAAQPDAPRPTPSPAAPGGLQVLVVDDEEVMRMVVSAMLETLGCTVALADDGAAAVEAVAATAFDLVFMDIRMPGMDGLEASRRIRAARPQQYIVALTANAYPQDQQHAREAGMNAFLSKPVSLASLRSALAQCIAPDPAAGSGAAP